MSERSYKKKFELQKKIISKQSEQIEILKSQVTKLELECGEKDEIINSVTPLRNELLQNVNEAKKYGEECKKLIEELRKMKTIIDQTVYKGRWKLVQFLIK